MKVKRLEIHVGFLYRDGGMRGMFSGAGARVGRAGPSVAIVVSFYEVVKYGLHRFHQQ